MIPYRTGREVYVGALSWTPDWDARVRETHALFEGDMAPAEAQALARRSGARFAFVDCRPGLRDLRPVLGPRSRACARSAARPSTSCGHEAPVGRCSPPPR